MISSGFSAVINGPSKKSAASMTRGPDFADDSDLRVAGDRNARHFGGGIGVRDTAAGGAAVADLIMRDMLDGGDQERMRRAQPLVVENLAPAHHGAERDAVGCDLDLPQLAELAQIDQQRRRGDAKRHHRHQALAAGKRFGFAVVRGQQRNRFGDRGRAGVFEGRKFHACHASSSCSRPTIQRTRRRR